MLVKTYGSAVYGIEAITINIEVNITSGTHTFLVGLPDNAVKESMLRVESAIKSNGFYMPRTKVIINLAPADIRKSGSAFDLPIAVGILAASDQIVNIPALDKYIIMGELGLDGTIQPIKGALPIAITSRRERFRGLILPSRNAREASIVNNLEVYGLNHLNEVVSFLETPESLKPVQCNTREVFIESTKEPEPDFADVRGQEHIKRALEIAAAGGHNAILIGPPGSGKTMMARRLPSILPPLTLNEALETTRIHSVAGKLPDNATLISKRPFRSPHHTISDMALAGGGGIPQPGEISLAHNGVLFLDELPEFRRSALEVMRQPLEERRITISRAKAAMEFPASFMLIASMNPCPCGFYNHPEKDCNCLPPLVQKYLNKVSGPLLDRIDLHVEVTPVTFSELTGGQSREASAAIRKRVIDSREIQGNRLINFGATYCNAQMDNKMVKDFCIPDTAGLNLLRNAMQRLSLSARAYERILKVSRTIADLAGSVKILPEHIAEAIQFRSLDRQAWAG
ncbi:YifB family Mg chelatase-like AAA ATPase [Flavihumibacter solisilvae]|uniref:Magnesium chelatase n=1 Tax=Flavihumibacter solisilvae TaxID=1349421 RepID=A0A0C1IF95_9BACT|nr:YifB family Mg chelatase-like AAA ATPase [Flavihumibacter solisilvae]KIC92825.1 magnesium chelatase [Flavihumibacter solisilvae]